MKKRKKGRGEERLDLEAGGVVQWYGVYLVCSRPWVKSLAKEERAGVREEGKEGGRKGRREKKEYFKLL